MQHVQSNNTGTHRHTRVRATNPQPLRSLALAELPEIIWIIVQHRSGPFPATKVPSKSRRSGYVSMPLLSNSCPCCPTPAHALDQKVYARTCSSPKTQTVGCCEPHNTRSHANGSCRRYSICSYVIAHKSLTSGYSLSAVRETVSQ